MADECDCLESCRLDDWSDQFVPSTRELLVFTKSAKRYFDLDAVREPYGARSAKNAGYPTSYRSLQSGGYDERERTVTLHPAGAPPLDWWQIPSPQPPPVTPYEGDPMTATFYVGDAIETMNRLPEKSVDLILTSPPFLALRSYLPADHPDKALEGGSQATPGAFIDWLIDVVEACDRVLAPHGSMCIELGDTYAGSGGAGGDYNPGGWRDGQMKWARTDDGGGHPISRISGTPGSPGGTGWPLAKSLSLIPELFRLTLVYGTNPLTGRTTERWRLRNVVRWVRPNPPVGALGDKFRPATSELMVFCKSAKRYFDLDAVREPAKTGDRVMYQSGNADRATDGKALVSHEGFQTNHPAGAPPLDWWNIPPGGYEGAHYACVDDETEALTPHGWRSQYQLADGDLIAAYNQEAGTITWEPATFHRYPFDGELVAIEKRETSQRLTPNHRVIYKTRFGVEHVGVADELKPSHRLPVAAPFAIPDTEAPTVDMAALIGWFITEGSARVHTANIYQSETANPKHCAEIRRLLKAVGADFVEASRLRANSLSPRLWIEVVWRIHGDVATELLAYRNRPQFAFWPEPQAQALFDAMVDGDGHRRADGRISFVSHNRNTIDMFQALTSRLGRRSTIHVRPSGYEITVGERTWLSLRGTNGVHDPIGREYYKGTVWCPSVPSSFWLARRNGRPFITGNTFPPELCIKPIKAMCPERVCKVCGEPSRRITTDPVYVGDDGATVPIDVEWSAGRRLTDNSWTPKRGHMTRSTEVVGFSDCGHQQAWHCTVDGTFTEEIPGGASHPRHDEDKWVSKWRPGLVLDPFVGSGTTLMVATGHGRDAIGIDLDARNFDLALQRVGPFILESA